MTHPLLHLDEHHRRADDLHRRAQQDRLARSARRPRRARLPRLRVSVQLVRPVLR